jgi:hypothetical protein
MAFQVDRSAFDPESGFEYYICFKPEVEVEGDEVRSRIPIEVAVSISETGDVADLSFVLPKMCRNDHALSFLKRRPPWNLTTAEESSQWRSTAAFPRPARSSPHTRRRAAIPELFAFSLELLALLLVRSPRDTGGLGCTHHHR